MENGVTFFPSPPPPAHSEISAHVATSCPLLDSQGDPASAHLLTPTSIPSDETRALLKEIYAEIDEFYATVLLKRQSIQLSKQPTISPPEVGAANARGTVHSSLAVPTSSDNDPSSFQSTTPIDLTKIDYQSLPPKPEVSIDWYDPDLGDRVTTQWHGHRVRDAVRVAKYGKEIAEAYRRGQTPSPVRRNYIEDCERQEREAEMSLTEDEGEMDGDKLREAKRNVSDKEKNEASDKLLVPVKKSPSPMRPGPHNLLEGDDESFAANSDQVHRSDGSRKRRRDERATLGDTSEGPVGTKVEEDVKRRKKGT